MIDPNKAQAPPAGTAPSEGEPSDQGRPARESDGVSGELPTAAARLRALGQQTDAAAREVVTTVRKVTDGGRPPHAPVIAGVDTPLKPARDTTHMLTMADTRGEPLRFAAEVSVLARLMHALIAVAAVLLVLQGHLMKVIASADPPGPAAAIAWHRATGMAVLVLMVCALCRRIYRGPSYLPGDLAPKIRHATQAINFALFALLFLLPICGWLEFSAAAVSPQTRVLGLFVLRPLPALAILPLQERLPLRELFVALHAFLAILLELTICLHVALVLARWRRARTETKAAGQTAKSG